MDTHPPAVMLVAPATKRWMGHATSACAAMSGITAFGGYLAGSAVFVTGGVSIPIASLYYASSLGWTLLGAYTNKVASDPPRMDFKNLVLPYKPQIPNRVYKKSDSPEKAVPESIEDLIIDATQYSYIGDQMIITMERLQGAEKAWFASYQSVQDRRLFHAVEAQKSALRQQLSDIVDLNKAQIRPLTVMRDRAPTLIPALVAPGIPHASILSGDKATAVANKVRRQGAAVIRRVERDLGIDVPVMPARWIKKQWASQTPRPWNETLDAAIDFSDEMASILSKMRRHSTMLHRTDAWFDNYLASIR